jgi:hypothetical protein
MRSKSRRWFPIFRAPAVTPAGILVLLGVFTAVVPRIATVAAQLAQPASAPQEHKGSRPLVVGMGGKTFKEGLIPAPIPPLPGKNAGTVDGVILNAPFWMTDPRSVHEGVFSDGLDLSESPQLAICTGSDPSCGWVTGNTGVHASSPDFGMVLQQAIDDATSRELPKLDGGFLTEGFDILKTLASYSNDTTQIGSPVTTQRFLGYQPEYGRWLQKTENRLTFTYPDPPLMANLRERGARLYCAARTAQNQQSSTTKSMGKLTPFSFTLFGQNIDFLTVEPTLVLDGPLPYLGGPARCPVDHTQDCSHGSPNDGAQAFMVPFLMGTQITPLSLLPSLPEIREPVAMVTGDSEVLTPTGTALNEATYQTVTHSDAILSSEVTGSAGMEKLLATVGPVQIFADFGLTFGVGQLFSDENVTYPPPPAIAPAPPGMAAIAKDRLLGGMPPAWPPTRCSPDGIGCDVTTPALGSWDGGKWVAPPLFSANTPSTQVVSVQPENVSATIPLSLDPSNPFLLRALEDDDRHVWNSTTFGLGAQIFGKFGKSFDFQGFASIDAALTAGGSLEGAVSMRHTLRDATLHLDQSPFLNGSPVSALTIEPSVGGKAILDALFVHLTLTADVDLGPLFGDHKVTIFDHDLFRTPKITVPLPHKPWPETNRFRLGTGSPSGDPLKAPTVWSHLPNAGLFASFPPGGDVDSCLANPAQNQPAPPPCGPQPPATTTPPSAGLCIYAGGPPPSQLGSVPLPPNVCSNVTGYVNKAMALSSPDERQCMIDKLNFLCQATSQEQNYLGTEVVAHVWDPTNQAEMAKIQNLTRECVKAGLESNPKQDPNTLANQLFGFSVCSAGATLFTPTQAANLTPNSGAGSPGPGSCR